MKEFVIAALGWARENVPSYLQDVIGLAGFAALLHGTALIYQPAAWILGGAGVLAGVTLLQLRKKVSK